MFVREEVLLLVDHSNVEYLLTYMFYMIICQYVVYKSSKIQYVDLEEYLSKRKIIVPLYFIHLLKGDA
jgi:hypothetical protein